MKNINITGKRLYVCSMDYEPGDKLLALSLIDREIHIYFIYSDSEKIKLRKIIEIPFSEVVLSLTFIWNNIRKCKNVIMVFQNKMIKSYDYKFI